MTTKQLDTLLHSESDKYSHNVQCYLRYRMCQFNDAHRLVVLKDDDGTLYLGIRERRPSTAFIGVRLCVVMTLGGRARSNEYIATRGWTLMKNFWSTYIEQGICLLDPKHNHYTHRWTYTRNTTRRNCKFCGHKEKLVQTRRTVIDEKWVSTGKQIKRK